MQVIVYIVFIQCFPGKYFPKILGKLYTLYIGKNFVENYPYV